MSSIDSKDGIDAIFAPSTSNTSSVKTNEIGTKQAPENNSTNMLRLSCEPRSKNLKQLNEKILDQPKDLEKNEKNLGVENQRKKRVSSDMSIVQKSPDVPLGSRRSSISSPNFKTPLE